MKWILDNLLELSLIFALIMVMLAHQGCATDRGAAVPPCCPPENAVIMTNAGMPVVIPKGYFDDKENWLTEQQFADWLKAMQIPRPDPISGGDGAEKKEKI